MFHSCLEKDTEWNLSCCKLFNNSISNTNITLSINTAVHVVILAEINVNMFDIPEYGYKSEKISCIIPHADFSIILHRIDNILVPINNLIHQIIYCTYI